MLCNADVLKRNKREAPTLGEAAEYWLQSKAGTVNASTHKSYKQIVEHWIIGPAIKGTPNTRRYYGHSGARPPTDLLVPMLGPKVKIDEIRTAEIRKWYLRVQDMATPYVARCARKALSSIFRMIEEDYDIRLARMPTRAGKAYRRKQRELLTEEQMRKVLGEAQRDKRWGVYYAFAFMTGVRPSEMLGLLWKDVDLDKGVARICRVQEKDGSLRPFTKTDAGMREVPLNGFLLNLLREWQERCPHHHGKLHRVFPAQGNPQGRSRPPADGSDGALLLNNYRNRVWYPLFDRLGLPRIQPYAARHMALSFLQAQGVEIGMVAKVAGHVNPQITLQYYTHAVRECGDMMDKLSAAYGVSERLADTGTGVQI